jgi:hypothetical protein
MPGSLRVPKKVSINFSIDFWQGGCKETNQIALWLYEQK